MPQTGHFNIIWHVTIKLYYTLSMIAYIPSTISLESIGWHCQNHASNTIALVELNVMAASSLSIYKYTCPLYSIYSERTTSCSSDCSARLLNYLAEATIQNLSSLCYINTSCTLAHSSLPPTYPVGNDSVSLLAISFHTPPSYQPHCLHYSYPTHCRYRFASAPHLHAFLLPFGIGWTLFRQLRTHLGVCFKVFLLAYSAYDALKFR